MIERTTVARTPLFDILYDAVARARAPCCPAAVRAMPCAMPTHARGVKGDIEVPHTVRMRRYLSDELR